MNPNNFTDLLTFNLAPPAGYIFNLSGEISLNLQDGLTQMLVHIFMFHR